ncbi:tbc1 domain family member [Anaeramoeba flamelloides]|uniref:Tbc1 domain family member n=1 Tax=Anaeramoeba flamelloides TaxID=1746091 RepID=A0AAV7YTR3_9EUKA|nr:tbc1 domain family member [Anaeramoeba flamelloides]
MSLEKASKEYESIFQTDFDHVQLRSKINSHKYKPKHIRSIVWRVLLGVLGDDPNPQEFVKKATETRERYAKLKEKILVDPQQQDLEKKENQELEQEEIVDNPLALDEDSEWNQYFRNQELSQMIALDVERTMPGNEFFAQQKIQEMMIEVLVLYANLNTKIIYKQGMHELLATIIYLMNKEYLALERFAYFRGEPSSLNLERKPRINCFVPEQKTNSIVLQSRIQKVL